MPSTTAPPAEPVRELAQAILPELGPSGSVEIAAPPAPGDDERGWPALLLPILSGVGMLGFALVSRSLLALALGGGFAALSAVAAVAAWRHQRRRRRRAWDVRSQHFRAQVCACVAALAEGASRQRSHAAAAHPSPAAAAASVRAGVVWSRVATSTRDCAVRLGLGSVPALLLPRRQHAVEPTAAADLTELADDAQERYGYVGSVPLTLDLTEAPAVILRGDLLPLARAMIVSLARSFGPQALRIHALAASAEQDWIRRLPHAGAVEGDAGMFISQLSAGLASGERDLDFPTRHVVVLAAGEATTRAVWRDLATRLRRDGEAPSSVLALLPGAGATPAPADVVISLDAEGCLLVQQSGERPPDRAVALPDALSHAQALNFAKTVQTCLPQTAPAGRLDVSPRLASLLDAGRRHALQLPIGVDDDGAPVTLDLREAARLGDGPHGLIVGATGTGKSELLRTVLAGAAQQNSPQSLTFLLVDYKGGAALSALTALPHTAGLLTNLTEDTHGVERLCAALRAEMCRRQRLLRQARADDIDAFRATRAGGTGGALPRLLVVVDEYAELIEQSPEVLDVLTSVARLGRSLGMHLLLCSQRLDDGRLRGLEAHLRYRICLRTFTAAESVAALGSPDAARLPAAPGWGYLNRDGVLTRLRVALADGLPGPSVSRQEVRARQVCPPPLPEALSLDQVSALRIEPGGPAVALGRCDRPDLGEQPPLRYDPASDGHVAVIGAPRTGRSTALTTLVVALASAIRPRELAVHVVTSAGSPLVATGGLPHVGTVATTPALAARVIRTVAESLATRRAHGGHDGSRILLVVDDLAALLAAEEELAAAIALIATAGQAVGVTLAASCGRWAELRGGMREAMTTRLELACHDPGDSMLPQIARTFPRRPAGRVLTGDGHWAQIALPRADGVASTDGLAAAVTAAVAGLARRGGVATAPIQLLPPLLPAASLAPPRSPDAVVLGVTGPYVQPVEIGLTPGEHLLVLGNSRTGRSGLLRAVAASRRRQGARTWIIDPRQSFAGCASAFRRACSADDALALIHELEAVLAQRTAPGTALVKSCRDVLFIDDLEWVAGKGWGALPALQGLLRMASEVGLSVVCARRLSGYGRAAYEPFFATFLEMCENAVVLSGDPAEGLVIGGVRPHRLPRGRGELVLGGEPAGELQAAWLAGGEDSVTLSGSVLRQPAALAGNEGL